MFCFQNKKVFDIFTRALFSLLPGLRRPPTLCLLFATIWPGTQTSSIHCWRRWTRSQTSSMVLWTTRLSQTCPTSMPVSRSVRGEKRSGLICYYQENLRMFGPVARNDRKCVKDWQGEGEFSHINIPRGTLIRLAYHVIHHDHQYWPEPEQFRPERFLKENAADVVPFSFVAFGSGPRQCIGKDR